MNYLNEPYTNLITVAKENNKNYLNAYPFPNITFKNFFNPSILTKILEEFPDLSKTNSISYNDEKEKKFASIGEILFGEETKKFMHFLNSQPFLEFLQHLTGIDETLFGDPYFSGGGLHELKRGGLLKIHADFNKHPSAKLDRRINVLVYLNKNWKEEYGGHFELWDKSMTKCMKKILPEFNTMAIFTTTDFSYHGNPDPVNCPPEMSRKSLALYYFTYGRPEEEINLNLGEHSTLFKKRAGNINDSEAFKSNTKSLIKDFIPPILFKILKKNK